MVEPTPSLALVTERDHPRSDDEQSSGGTYSLLLTVDPTTIDVGALGDRTLDAGTYVYTGSAFGPGGFARVDRHRAIATGERDVRHWHVDYVLGAPATTLTGVWTSPGDDRECAIATELPGTTVDGVGASDCDCDAHLLAFDDRERAEAALDDLHHRRGVPD